MKMPLVFQLNNFGLGKIGFIVIKVKDTVIVNFSCFMIFFLQK